MITVNDLKNHLGIDYADEMVEKNLKRLIKTADSYLKGAIGENYPDNDPRAKELALIVAADLYDNRDLNAKVSNNVRNLVNDFMLQLRLEMRGLIK